MNIGQVNALLQAQTPFETAKTAPAPQPQAGPDFAEMLGKALDAVQQSQVQSDDLAQKLATGQTDDVVSVMAASEKASLNLSLALQVRNKLLDAYQEIMRTPL